MTELRKLSDSVLLERTQNLVKTERATTTLILEHLLELDRRKLFAGHGYSSLFSYCVEHLKYSEAAAMRRISSMRLLKGLTPHEAQAVETKIQDGSLSLSVLAQTQSFFQQEAKAKTPLNDVQKREVLAAVVGMSSRQATRELQNRSSQEAPPVLEYTRPAQGGRTEIHLVVDAQTLERLEKLKGFFSHAHPRLGWGELVGLISELAWEKVNPARERRAKNEARPATRTDTPFGLTPSQVATSDSALPPTSEVASDCVSPPTSEVASDRVSPPTSVVATDNVSPPTSVVATDNVSPPTSEPRASVNSNLRSSAIPRRIAVSAVVKREVWRRSGGTCCYVDPKGGKRCGSRYFLELDHIIAIALGGGNESTNLVLHCRSHNQFRAIQSFGLNKMDRYLRPRRSA